MAGGQSPGALVVTALPVASPSATLSLQSATGSTRGTMTPTMPGGTGVVTARPRSRLGIDPKGLRAATATSPMRLPFSAHGSTAIRTTSASVRRVPPRAAATVRATSSAVVAAMRETVSPAAGPRIGALAPVRSLRPAVVDRERHGTLRVVRGQRGSCNEHGVDMATPTIGGTALEALLVLDFAGEHRDPIPFADVTAGLGIHRAAAYRLPMTPIEAGCLRRAKGTRRVAVDVRTGDRSPLRARRWARGCRPTTTRASPRRSWRTARPRSRPT